MVKQTEPTRKGIETTSSTSHSAAPSSALPRGVIQTNEPCAHVQAGGAKSERWGGVGEGKGGEGRASGRGGRMGMVEVRDVVGRCREERGGEGGLGYYRVA